MTKWQKVYASEHSYKAEIVKDILEKEGLSPVLINKKDTAYSNFGLYEIHINTEEALIAVNIIENDINFK